MRRISRRNAAATALAACALAAGTIAAAGSADPSDPLDLTAVPAANTKAPGFSSPTVLSAQLDQLTLAQGSTPLENPTACIPSYGYDAHAPGSSSCTPAAPHVPIAATSTAEANKTEPDKNTYLVTTGLSGADPAYDYGTHFLFQGHETGSPGYITRINLDADPAHRVTLVASTDKDGKPLPTYDGSTWDPFAQRLLFTAESGSSGGVWQATTTVPSTVVSLQGILGIGGYEGIQNDSAGNLWIVEDIGGKAGATSPNAKQPNSFVYRFKPVDPSDLTKGGKLQALQVGSLRAPGQPIVFTPASGAPTAAQADADIQSGDTQDLHSYGRTFATKWITVHDTAVDGTAPYSANAAAKAAKATPFKRPENGVFQPGSRFRTFVFTETGDTNKLTEADAAHGGFGGLQRLDQSSPSADTGTLRMLYQGDVAHTGLDNIQFLSRNAVAAVEDAGDTLHAQRNALDSGYLFDLRSDYSVAGATPLRFMAEGRDPSATIDSLGGPLVAGNDGDNEITGIHASDGDPTAGGILGAKLPRLFRGGGEDRGGAWRLFYTAQHGDNATFEVIARRAPASGDDG